MVRINEKFKKRLFPLTNEEYETLKSNIEIFGLIDSIITWKDALEGETYIVDGHNRYQICNELNIEPLFIEKEFKTEDDVLDWIDRNQFGRRNLNDLQRKIVIGRMYESRKRQGLRNDLTCAQNEHKLKTSEKIADIFKGNQYTNKINTSGGAQNEHHQKRTAEKISDELGISRETVKRAAKMHLNLEKIKNKDEDFYDKIVSGEIKVDKSSIERLAEQTNENLQDIKDKAESGVKFKSLTSLIKETEKEKYFENKELETNKEYNFTLYNKDCVEILKELEDNSIDLVITDPPYAVDFKPSWCSEKSFNNDSKDYVIPLLEETCSLLQKKCKLDSHLYFFSGYVNLNLFQSILSKYFDVQDNFLIWIKNNTSLVNFDKRYANKYECIIFCKQKGHDERLLRNKQSADVLNYNKVHNPIHSCEKPVDLLEYLIDNSSIEGEVVLDCFAGTMNSGIATINKKRKYIGIELDKKWFNIGENKLKNLTCAHFGHKLEIIKNNNFGHEKI
jgi:site-specific DNA-methyltransferase (adenine-specific)